MSMQVPKTLTSGKGYSKRVNTMLLFLAPALLTTFV